MRKILVLCCFALTLSKLNAQVPVISSFSPTSGPIGSSVVITGNNFNTTPANNIVYFGATKAVVSAASVTSLTVTVPSGATYKSISVTNNNLTAYSRLPFVTSYVTCGGTLIDAVAWNSPVSYSSGAASSYLLTGTSIADIDGDGKPDLLAMKQGSGIGNDSIFIFRNTSTVGTINASSFATAIGFRTGVNAAKIIIGDLDGDGKFDLVTTSNNLGAAFNFAILRNTSTVGSLSFAAPQVINFTNLGYALNIAIGDLDGDGKPDLAIANYNLLVKRNTSTVGAISFTNDAIITSPGSTYMVLMGDIDGDGKIDLITDGSGSSDLLVKRNTSSVGSISMSAGATFSNLFSVNPTLVGDLDGDSKLDIVTTSGMTYRNTSTSGVINAGSFAAPVKVLNGAATLHITDIDGDGKPDLASGAAAYKNDCSPGVITSTSFTTAASISSVDIQAVGDLDGDNLPDYVYTTNNSVNVVKSQPPAMTVNASQLNPACGFTSTGSASAIVAYAASPLTYTWSTIPAQNTAIATNLNASTFSVTATDNNGCTATGTVTISQPPAPTRPAICMVTVDEPSNYNEIYWDKTLYPNLDSMIIWRETTSNTYKQVGAVHSSALSFYVDTARSIGPANGNPNIGTYRYKIQIRDTCGNYSLKSLWHNTVFFINSGSTFFWNEYRIEGDPIPTTTTNPMTQFDLVRDDFAPTGNYNTVGTVAGTQTTLNDPFYPVYVNTADWRVYAYGLTCEPTMRIAIGDKENDIQTVVVRSKSNIKNNRTVGIKDTKNQETRLKVYPNPASDLLNVDISTSLNVTTTLKETQVTITIENMLGQVVYTTQTTQKLNHLNISTLVAGVYFVKVNTGKGISVEKVILE